MSDKINELKSATAQKLAELKKRNAELQEQIKTESKAAFDEFIADIFKRHPKLESFSWTQYTPYFNDGDECTFSANLNYLNFVFDGGEVEDVGNYSLSNRSEKYPEGFVVCAKEVLDVMGSLNDDGGNILKGMFGDHQKITVSAKGVEAEDYEHD